MADISGPVDGHAPTRTRDRSAPSPALTRTLAELAGSVSGRDDGEAEAWPMQAALTATLTSLLPGLPGARWASVTVRRHPDSPAVTAASAGDVAERIDRWQYAAAQGPCLDALSGGVTVAAHLEAERRWPALVPRVLAQTPVRGVISAPVPVATPMFHAASVNVYGDRPDRMCQDAVAGAELAAAAVAVASTAHALRWQARNLEHALETSRTIAAAVGIVMANRRVTYDVAYEALRTVSQRTHRKVRDVADDVLATGELPEVG